MVTEYIKQGVDVGMSWVYHLESRWLATPKYGGLGYGAMINQDSWELRHLLSRWYNFWCSFFLATS